MRVCDICRAPYQGTAQVYANLTSSEDDADALIDLDLCEKHYQQFIGLVKILKTDMKGVTG